MNVNKFPRIDNSKLSTEAGIPSVLSIYMWCGYDAIIVWKLYCVIFYYFVNYIERLAYVEVANNMTNFNRPWSFQ